MKVFIMAAGIGSRISEDIKGIPKSMVSFKGETLMSRNIRLFRSIRIESIYVAVGYKGHLVEEEIGQHARAIYNENFNNTNSIKSLELCLLDATKHSGVLDDDLLILNGDVFFEESLIEILGQVTKEVEFIADSGRIAEADYRLQWRNGVVIQHGKNLPIAETSGEYVGIVKIPKAQARKFLEVVSQYCADGRTDKWWEEVLLENPNIFENNIRDINGLFWAELDYVADVKRVQQYFKTIEVN